MSGKNDRTVRLCGVEIVSLIKRNSVDDNIKQLSLPSIMSRRSASFYKVALK
jgi:hypothetical protein